MSFVIVIPMMDFSQGLQRHWRCVERYFRRQAVAAPGSHSYMMGLQHRRTGDSLYWQPEKASVMYFLQNDDGAQLWPVTDAVVSELIAEFNPISTATSSQCVKAG